MPRRSVRYGESIEPSPSSLPSSPSTNTACSASSNTRTITSSVTTPFAPVTVSRSVTVLTSAGASNVGVDPASEPAPPVTSGPDIWTQTTDSSGVSAVRSSAARSTVAPTSTARSGPPRATAVSGVVVVVSGASDVLVVDVVELVELVVVVVRRGAAVVTTADEEHTHTGEQHHHSGDARPDGDAAPAGLVHVWRRWSRK